MNAHTPPFGSGRERGRLQFDRPAFERPSGERASGERVAGERSSASANATSMRWAALSEAGMVVAALAGVEGEKPGRIVRNFPVLIRECPQWRRKLADNGVADLAAIMEPGIAALLAINARGADPRPAARALLREFTLAREAILSLLPPSSEMGPRRSA